MRRLACAALFLLACPIALAQMLCHPAAAGPGSISPCEKKLVPAGKMDFQQVEWPAVMDGMKNNPALPFFKQGMTQYYGLNYEEAMLNFKLAWNADPKLAMAQWGIALAAGPNINLNMTDACNALACEAIACAESLAGGARKEGCEPGKSTTQLEKELIDALKKRYVCPPKLSGKEAQDAADKAAQEYSDAMALISKDHPNDRNVSTLYAESMMNLHPWDLYDRFGLPKRPQTITIVDVLKKATADSTEAIGANHYYIHAVEGSNPDPAIGSIHPIDGLTSANLLQTQVPPSGHLVHMSSHIYLLLGDYEKSVVANIKGSNDDVAQYSDACRGTYTMYTKNDRCPQLYYGHYLSHNYFFGSVAATFLGQSKNAIALACDTQAHAQRFVAYEPGLQRYMAASLMTMVVNRNWDAICAETNCKGPNPFLPNSDKPNPDFKRPDFEECYSQGQGNSGCLILRAIWFYARGMARAAHKTTDDDVNAMKDDLKAMGKEIDAIPACSETNKTAYNTFGNNCAKDILRIGQKILAARIQWSEVEKIGPNPAFVELKDAVYWEDHLMYDEPPQWFTPAREAFGGAYLQAAKDAVGSQKTRYYRSAHEQFDEALRIHPGSGRALYGKMRALQELGEEEAAKAAKAAFYKAWRKADYTMTDADLWPDQKVSPPPPVVVEPSKCLCRLPKWTGLLPPSDAKDLPAGAVQAGSFSVDYTLLACPPTP